MLIPLVRFLAVYSAGGIWLKNVDRGGSIWSNCDVRGEKQPDEYLLKINGYIYFEKGRMGKKGKKKVAKKKKAKKKIKYEYWPNTEKYIGIVNDAMVSALKLPDLVKINKDESHEIFKNIIFNLKGPRHLEIEHPIKSLFIANKLFRPM